IIEVSTLRSRSEYDSDEPNKVLPANNTFGTLEEDAYRRDLTINSLFYEVENNTIIDYVGGVQDLTDGIIRIVGEPEQRIIRDPVRILRAIRHAARNGFTIEEKTLEAITQHLEKLDLCPTSRIRDELLKDLRGGTSQAWVGLALQTGVFTTLFPFYQELFQDETEGEAVKKELLSLFAALDNIERVTLEDAMLFAILLFPWALRRFDLLHQELKGPGYHRLSKAIRADLDQLFARRLNIKRAIKDKITTLFVNMSSLQKHRTKDTWPAWLRRKSYFKDCSRFYALYQESISCEQSTDIVHFVENVPRDRPKDVPKEKRQEKTELPVVASNISADKPQRGGRRGNNPAFSSDKQGVFGLRTV
ncbi:CCA tRNA nucleotidyltransferase, partial [Desulfobulbus sp. TB]|nr:CCA tRNA nucleotidyltransferase [Desulfobulbus sp. TB]